VKGPSRLTIDPFLGKTNDRRGKEGGDDYGDDVGDECEQEGGDMWVFLYKLGVAVIHLYTFLDPNYAKEYPRPKQHGEDEKKQQKI